MYYIGLVRKDLGGYHITFSIRDTRHYRNTTYVYVHLDGTTIMSVDEHIRTTLTRNVYRTRVKCLIRVSNRINQTFKMFISYAIRVRMYAARAGQHVLGKFREMISDEDGIHGLMGRGEGGRRFLLVCLTINITRSDK